MKEALFYKKISDLKVQCLLCPHFCLLASGEAGKCRARVNRNGVLYAENYGRTISVSLDPIEKKPLYHFYPGSEILSIGPNSCNLACDFCQNYQSSQLRTYTQEISPRSLLKICRQEESDLVAFTYTEPITWYEFIMDAAKELKQYNIKIVLVTNGFINQEPLAELLPHIDALNIDLKSINDLFYKKFCSASLTPVQNTIRDAFQKCHLEITNLLITNENDSDNDISELVDFVASVNADIPLHFSRYYPCYKMTNPPTPVERLEKAKAIAEKKLNYVYLGNIISNKDTKCPICKSVVIRRGFETSLNLADDSCPTCGSKIYGTFQ